MWIEIPGYCVKLTLRGVFNWFACFLNLEEFLLDKHEIKTLSFVKQQRPTSVLEFVQ